MPRGEQWSPDWLTLNSLPAKIVDCPISHLLIFYLSVFHDKCQTFKYERNTAGNFARAKDPTFCLLGNCVSSKDTFL